MYVLELYGNGVSGRTYSYNINIQYTINTPITVEIHINLF